METLGPAVAAAYLLGSVPFGWIFGRVFFGIDLRRVGSGNVGATNLARAAPRPWGPVAAFLAFLLDAGKGAAAALAIPRLAASVSGAAPPEWLPIACAAAAILGHSFSVFLRFRGGKSVAVSLGALACLMPAAAACALGVWGLVLAAFRIVSVASISAAAALPAAYALLPPPPGGRTTALTALAIAVAFLVAWRHRSNLARFLAGTEPPIALGRGPAEKPPAPPIGPENP